MGNSNFFGRAIYSLAFFVCVKIAVWKPFAPTIEVLSAREIQLDWLILLQKVRLSQHIKFLHLSRCAAGDRLELSRARHPPTLAPGHQ